MASPRLNAAIAIAGTAVLAWHLREVHRWFAEPFAVWTGWDEAYIAAFAERMLDGRWLPYVDAVSHRGPVLYWIAGMAQALGERGSWTPMRNAALFFAEANVLLALGVGLAARRPLAGFTAAAAFVFATTYGLEPKDGIAFNGELVAMPFALLATVLTVWGTQASGARSDARLWLAAGTGMAAVVGGLSKQIAILHLLPLALWWTVDVAVRKQRSGNLDLRPLATLVVGAATPLLAVAAFYARAGHLRALLYYYFTYNKVIYLGPVTTGYAIESTYLYARGNTHLLLVTALLIAWAVAPLATRSRAQGLLAALHQQALSTVTALQLLVALIGAVGTFRFWGHYFITALPWFGLLLGLLVDERHAPADRHAPAPAGTLRHALAIASVVGLSFVLCPLTRMFLDGQRHKGLYGPPADDPVVRYITSHSSPDDSILVWGFAADLYISSHRKSATRFVFTTFPSGIVPWFHWMTLEQEDALQVPGSRAVLLRELHQARPALLVDVPETLHGRSIRRYADLAAYVESHYCFETALSSGPGRLAFIYRQRNDNEPCTEPLPPLALPSKE